jgi:hypothetical protein
MTVTRITKEFQGEQGPYGLCRRNFFRPRQSGLLKKVIEGYGDQVGNEQKQATELGSERFGIEIESSYIGDCGGGGRGVSGRSSS